MTCSSHSTDANQGIKFAEELPSHLDDLGQTYREVALPDWLRSGTDTILASAQDNLAGVDQGAVVAGLIGGTLSLIGGFFAWLLLPFFLFYLLKDQPTMAHTFYQRVPAPWKADVSIAAGFALGGILGAILVLPSASIVRDVFRYFFDQAVQESLVSETVSDAAAGGATS